MGENSQRQQICYNTSEHEYGLGRRDEYAKRHGTACLTGFLDITTNSISPVSYTEFLSSGVIGFIPSNVHAVDLASFGQSPTVSFDFERSDGLSGFSVTVNGNVHLFDSTSASDIWFPRRKMALNIL